MAEPRQLLSPIRQQYPGRAVGADYATEGSPKRVSNSMLREPEPLVPTAAKFGLDPRLTPPIPTILVVMLPVGRAFQK